MINKLKDEGFREFLKENSSGVFKVCSDCGNERPIEMYNFRTDTGKYRDQCNACHKKYSTSIWLRGMFSDYKLSLGLKECSKCKKELPISEFGSDKYTRNKLTSNCKSCISIKGKTEKCRLSTRKSRYNATDADISKFDSIDNCEICGKEVSGKKKCFDHSHVSGKYRGVLCTLCNQAIGMLNDDVNTLNNAIKYITERGK